MQVRFEENDSKETEETEVKELLRDIRKAAEGLHSVLWKKQESISIQNEIEAWKATIENQCNDIRKNLFWYNKIGWKNFAIDKSELEKRLTEEEIEEEKERLKNWWGSIGRISDFCLLFKDQVTESKLLEKLSHDGFHDLKHLHVLDLGCGDGQWLRKWLEWGAVPERLTGVDFYEPLLKRAIHLTPSVQFIQAHPDELPFEDKQFNVIFMFGVLMHILDDSLRKKIGRECLRVLSDDGILITFNLNKGEEKRLEPYVAYNTIGVDLEELMLLFPDCHIDFDDLSPYSLAVIGKHRLNRRELNANGA